MRINEKTIYPLFSQRMDSGRSIRARQQRGLFYAVSGVFFFVKMYFSRLAPNFGAFFYAFRYRKSIDKLLHIVYNDLRIPVRSTIYSAD